MYFNIWIMPYGPYFICYIVFYFKHYIRNKFLLKYEQNVEATLVIFIVSMLEAKPD